MKKLFFFAIILFISSTWGGGKVVAQTANEPGSGNALSFDGVDDYVQLSANPAINFNHNSSFTMEAWVRFNSTAGNQVLFTKQQNITNEFFYTIQVQSSNLLVAVGQQNVTAAIAWCTFVPASNQWYHVSGVSDGTSISLYVNGVWQSTTPFALTSTPSVSNPRIGFNYNNVGGLNGQLDEVRIWNRALTQAEIQQNMCRKLPDCADPNLVGYWRLDEGTDNTCSGGQDVCDASCNGNHGIKF